MAFQRIIAALARQYVMAAKALDGISIVIGGCQDVVVVRAHDHNPARH